MIAFAVLTVAFTDVTLQLDNVLAVSAVASSLPSAQRPFILAGGVALAAACLLAFTILGTTLIERLAWLKLVAGIALVVIGIRLTLQFINS